MEECNVSSRLTEFAANVRYETLPQEVIDAVKLFILDQFGVQLGLSGRPVSQIALGYASSFGAGPSTILGAGGTAPSEFAAFCNGVYGHAFELDDLHMPSLNHPGPLVVAPAFAMGEAMQISGKKLIEAVACGYEVMGRIGRGMGRDFVYGTGFHPVGVLGPLGSAMAAGKVMGLSASQMKHALGLATSHGAGTIEYNQTWGETTRLHAGLAAMGGIRSATLAKAGMTGPGSPIAGKYGFARVHSNECDFELMVRDLGEVYTLLYNTFKLRPYHGVLHAVIDKALECMAEAGIKGEDAANLVKEVRVGLNSAAMRGLVEGDEQAADEQLSSTQAQFSLHGPLANAMVYGGTIESVWNFDARDPKIEPIKNRVTARFDEACEAEWYRETGHAGSVIYVRVAMDLVDGRTIETFGAPFKEPRKLSDMHAKFRDLATRVIDGTQAERLLERLDSLESIENVNALSALVRV